MLSLKLQLAEKAILPPVSHQDLPISFSWCWGYRCAGGLNSASNAEPPPQLPLLGFGEAPATLHDGCTSNSHA